MGGFYTPVPTDVLTAANWDAYVRNQTINQFASSAARDSAITSPVEGMYADAADTNLLTRHNGAAWEVLPWAQYKRKSVDETVNNVTALQNDDDLAWSVGANGVYELRMLLLYNSGTTPDIKFAWTWPVGLTMTWIVTGFDTSATLIFGNIDGESAVRSLGGTGANVAATVTGIVNVGSTAGTLQLQWAQNTANVSNTVVKAGSWGALTRYV